MLSLFSKTLFSALLRSSAAAALLSACRHSSSFVGCVVLPVVVLLPVPWAARCCSTTRTIRGPARCAHRWPHAAPPVHSRSPLSPSPTPHTRTHTQSASSRADANDERRIAKLFHLCGRPRSRCPLLLLVWLSAQIRHDSPTLPPTLFGFEHANRTTTHSDDAQPNLARQSFPPSGATAAAAAESCACACVSCVFVHDGER